ncbi:MAG: altronate dehydratase family protein [Bacteroidota bacterium]
MKTPLLKIHSKDNVLVALEDLKKGTTIAFESLQIKLPQDIKAKHKLALTSMQAGDTITMYGTVVGEVQQAVTVGAALTTHNVRHIAETYGPRKAAVTWTPPDHTAWQNKTFEGFHRKDGQVGTANYWLVIPLVFCENRNVAVLKDAFLEELGFAQPNPYKQLVRQMVSEYKDGEQYKETAHTTSTMIPNTPIFHNIDGLKFLTHQGGCGGTREDAQMLCSLIAGYLNNPNVAGATILSLGCQNAQITLLQEALQRINATFDKTVYFLEQQQEGTEEKLLTKAIQKTFEGLIEANKTTRQPAPLHKLTLGLECGGSDGFSGISANPAVGHASDLIVALGGKTMLAEFPELCGVEQQLIDRSIDEDIAQKFVRLMKAYSDAAVAVGSGFDSNPSPGNIKDGLITDAMKSAGAAKKGGTSPITDVLDYGEYAKKHGLNLLCTPGNDVESTTALAGSGANIILFTTGLGTPTGNPITPVIKIASNTTLADRMPDIIDVDAGTIVTGEHSIEVMGAQLLDFIIQVASGKIKTKAQQLGQDDFIPWKRGVSL